jgi:hypothetical protein
MTNAAITLERKRTGRPRIRTNDDAITFWTERVVTKPLDSGDWGHTFDHNSIVVRGDRIFHYGSHFCLAEILRRPSGNARLILFNGDQWRGPSGWGHSTSSVQMTVQRAVRQQIEESDANVPTVTIPFTALDAAGIEYASIKPLHVMDDRTERLEFSSTERPGPLRKMPDPNGATYAHSEETWGFFDAQGVWVPNGYELSIQEREERGIEHKRGTKIEERPVLVDNPRHARVDHNGFGWCHEGAELGDDGVWRWTVEQHKLGEALFTGRYTSTHWRELTPDERTTWDAQMAWSARYRELGYPTPDDAQLAELGERPTLDVEVTVRGEEPHVRFTKTHVEKFLSSYDYAEPHRPYFLCELRHNSPARTIPEALEDLKPGDVKAAEALGLEILRQGDIFAIPTAHSEAELVEKAVTVERKFWREGDSTHHTEFVAIRKIGQEGYSTGAKDIHGSTHQVTHLIVTKNGDHYGRGRMYHRPSGWGRTPEHVVVDLGDRKTWYRLVRNTVPTDATGRARGGSQLQSGNARAWLLGGAVD